MKRSIVILLSVVISSCMFGQKASTFPDVKFDKYTFDFDTLEYAAEGICQFNLKNTGTAPLLISNAKGSCGCTVPTYPKGELIFPGQSSKIIVTYDTKRIGPFSKTVTVYSNAKSGTQTLKIKGFVKNKPKPIEFNVGQPMSNGMIPYE